MRLIDAGPLEDILRSRRAQCYNDYGSIAGAISGCLKLVQVQPTIAPPPNEPLTLEELREMDGEPVWIKENVYPGRWALVHRSRNRNIRFDVYLIRSDSVQIRAKSFLAGGGLVYRLIPEEG